MTAPVFSPAEQILLLKALDRAAHGTDKDLGCSDCRYGCCDDAGHARDWADVVAWRGLSRRLTPEP